MTPVISVVIPTHNPRADYLARVVEALRQQTLPRERWEIIVVDNGSKQPLRAGIRHTANGIREEVEALAGVGGQQPGDSQSNDSREKAQEGGSAYAVAAANDSGVTGGDLKLTNLKHNTPELELGWHSNARIVREEKLGLTFARLRGFAEAKGELIVMVDDDNLLDPDYLANALKIADEHKDVGAFGGKCLPEFETQPEAWMEEFLPLLALRDHGEKEIIAGDTRSADGSLRVYPDQAAPIGAGMVVRREAAAAYAEGIKQQAEGIRHTVWEQGRQESVGSSQGRPQRDRKVAERLDQETKRPKDQKPLTDRKGDSLASAGDNDLVFTVLRDGWKVGYFPQLEVTHLIPASRLTVDYFARANRGVQRSWVEVLRKHNACPWPIISRTSAPLRKVRAFLKCRGWQKPGGFIRWQAVSGRLDGLAV